MTKLELAFNDCTREIFGNHHWKTTRELRQSYGYDSVTERSKSCLLGTVGYTFAHRRQRSPIWRLQLPADVAESRSFDVT